MQIKRNLCHKSGSSLTSFTINRKIGYNKKKVYEIQDLVNSFNNLE